jgi:monoamine oxidase
VYCFTTLVEWLCFKSKWPYRQDDHGDESMNTANVPERVDVVVVGGGIAGLSAARDLLAANVSVLVLEARNRVGGRLLNHTLGNGSVVELGGQWVGPTQDRVLALAEELSLGLFPTYVEGEHFLAMDGSVKRYVGEDFALPESVLADLEETWEHLRKMADEIPLEGPWLAAKADTWDAQTVDSWLVTNTKTETGLGYWRTIVPALFSAETAELSLLHFLFYCRSGGTLDRLVATHGGAQESRLEGGSQQLAVRLADRLGDVVRLNSPVDAIRQDDRSVEVKHDGGVVRAGRAIVALPPTLAGRIRYSPALPPLRDQLTQQVPMGYVIKAQVAHPEPFWRIEGLSGSVFSLDDKVSIIFDNSPPELSCGVLLGFLEGRDARRAGKLPPEERKELVLSVFAKFFGPRALEPDEYVERDWAAEEWSRGCYGGRFGTGVWTGYGEALREPVDRIHWAGAETAEVWNGYMDGAVRSGERAAREVLLS